MHTCLFFVFPRQNLSIAHGRTDILYRMTLTSYSFCNPTVKFSEGALDEIACSSLVACVAGAKRGGGGGREKGKREGSACSKSTCFYITPTNFLVIRLRLLSIKCRYTCHCRKTLPSRTKEIRLVIQIQKALWRKLEPLFSRNKKTLYASKEVKEIALASEGKSCRPENNNYSQSICMS